MKEVKVPEELIYRMSIILLELEQYTFDNEILNEMQKVVKTQINAKLLQMEKREAYTKYKQAETAQEREEQKQKYIEKLGISKNFQY